MRRVYFDNSSTTFPKAPGVGEAMSTFITQVGCNIGRGSYETAYEAGQMVYDTRQQLCELFHFSPASHVVFTPSVTYSINYVIKGLIKAGDHMIISSMEHNAVARPAEDMKLIGAEVTTVPCDSWGRLDMEAFEASFRPNTRLVVMLHASNVCGTLLDAEQVGRICREKGVYFALDSAQSAGVVPIDFEKMGLSALCVTGHKGLLGPQGIGAMLVSEELARKLTPVISGGTGSKSHLLTMPDFMPDKFEAGTMNLPGIAGLHQALNFLKETGTGAIRDKEKDLTAYFIERLKELPPARIIGLPTAEGRTAVVSLDFDGIDNAEIAALLDSDYGIMTRCALHCAPLAHQTLGTYPEGTVRFSFGFWNTREEIDYAIDAMKEILL